MHAIAHAPASATDLLSILRLILVDRIQRFFPFARAGLRFFPANLLFARVVLAFPNDAKRHGTYLPIDTAAFVIGWRGLLPFGDRRHGVFARQCDRHWEFYLLLCFLVDYLLLCFLFDLVFLIRFKSSITVILI